MTSWLKRLLRPMKVRPLRTDRRRVRPALETLEDRLAPAVYLVQTSGDDTGLTTTGGSGTEGDPFLIGSLRSALEQANASTTEDDAIRFDPSLAGGTITLSGTQLSISDDVTLTGLGADSLTIDANNLSRHFTVSGGVTAELSGLTLVNGSGSGGHGGSILNSGSLTVLASVFRDNSTSGGFNGGAIFANTGSTLNVNDSTFTGNSTTGGGNGSALAIAGSSTANIARSTFTGNSAAISAAIATSGTTTITASTISGNTAGSQSGVGGILRPTGTLTLSNTIVAGNTSGGNPRDISGTVTDGGNNLIGHAGTAGGLTNGTNGNIVGADPLLAPLGDYGGPTPTMALLPGSPAIDKGTGTDADQRGIAVVNSVRDIGAFESRGFTIAVGAITPTSSSPQTTKVGHSFPVVLVAKVTANDADEPVLGGVISFSAPASGPSAILSGTSAVIVNTLGRAGVDARANGLPGSYDVTASAAGIAMPVQFALTNEAGAALMNDFPTGEGLEATWATDITLGPDGALWYLDRAFGIPSANFQFIGRMTTDGVVTHHLQIPTFGANPRSITAGPDGALWFTEFDANKIGRVTTDGVFTEFDVPTPDSGPADIVASSDGALWFTESGASKIGRITTDGQFTEFDIPTANASPEAIVVGPDGALWFTERAARKIGRITTDGQFTEFAIPTANFTPINLVVDSEGALRFAGAHPARAVGRFTTAGEYSEIALPTSWAPSGAAMTISASTLTLGPDGALWFVMPNIRQESGILYGADLNRIRPDGTLDLHYLPPFRLGNIQGMAIGPDGGLWFTQGQLGFTPNTPGRIGRIDTTQNLVVDNTGDISDGDYSAGQLTLREAVERANLLDDHNTITFDPTVFGMPQTITLVNGQLPALAFDVTIAGPGADLLTIDANHLSRIFEINSSVTAELRGLTLANGEVDASNGGAVLNRGTLNVLDCAIIDNVASLGGGIYSQGPLTVTGTTIAGNEAFAGGGAYLAEGTSALVNSTISGNEAMSRGGGLFVATTVTLRHLTVTGNRANTRDADVITSEGGGIYHDSPITIFMHNSIVAGNVEGLGTFPSDLGGLPVEGVSSNNLIGDPGSNGGLGDGELGNTVGLNGNPIDVSTVLSTTLAFNGGPTRTHRLVADGLAVNNGSTAQALDAAGNPLTRDQRGAAFVRRSGEGVDLGAYEIQNAFVVTTAADVVDPYDGLVSLREAVAAANGNPGADTITFAAGTNGMEIDLALGQMTITDPITIIGNGSANTILDGQQNSRLFDIAASAGDVTLDGLTLKSGRTAADGSANRGGAIRFLSAGALTIQNSVVTGNSTTGDFSYGGAVSSDSGAVTVTNSTFSGNSTAGTQSRGGAIRSDSGAVTVTNSTFSGNSVSEGGEGGAITTNSGSVTVTSSTLSGNFTLGDTSTGGALYSAAGSVTIHNSTLANNYTRGNFAYGGALYSFAGPVIVTSSTFSGNFTAGSNASGAAIGSPQAVVTVTNSTLSGNHTSGTSAHGGAISSSSGSVTLTNSTVVGNKAVIGGGIANESGPTTLRNSIVAQNTDSGTGPDLSPGTGTLTVHSSLIGTNQGSGLAAANPDANGNKIGMPGALLDPLLGPLAFNGGPTQTHALLPGSPALDAGDNARAVDGLNNPLTNDQRGDPFARVVGGRVDMGALESTGFPQSTAGAAEEMRVYRTVSNRRLRAGRRRGLLREFGRSAGKRVQIQLLRGPEVGRLRLRKDGSFVFTPPRGFTGQVTFIVRRFDGAGLDEQVTVVLNVNPRPRGFNVAPGQTLEVDADNGLLRDVRAFEKRSVVVQLVQGPRQGQLKLKPSGAFTFVASPGFRGTTTFRYQLVIEGVPGAVGRVLLTTRPHPLAERTGPPPA